MKHLGLKRLLILSVVLLVGISVSASNYLFFSEEKAALTKKIIEENQDYAKSIGDNIKSFIGEKIAGIHEFAVLYQDKGYLGTTEEIIEQTKILGATLNTNSARLAFEDGSAYWSQTSTTWPSHRFSGDIRTQGFYLAGRQAPGVTVTQPYLGSDGETYWITIAEKMGNGIVSTELQLQFLNKLVEAVTEIPSAAGIVLDSNTTVLATSTSDLELGKKANSYDWFADMARDTVKQDSTVQDFTFNGEDFIYFSQRINIGDKQWYFCVGISRAVAFAELDESAITAILTATIAVIASMVIAFILLQILYRPILALKQTVIDLSSGNGDLTQRLEVHSDDDLGLIAQGINRFIENLQQMMLEIQSATVSLQSHIDDMHQQSAHNDKMLQSHVAETEQVVTAIEEMNSTADAMATDAANTAEMTLRANEVGSASRTIAQQSQTTVADLITDVDNAVDSVSEMNHKTQGINNILDVISGIAEQTNLLALNAAIEAARAGEQGRGFAVVADEVRNLASRTKDSTEEVELALESLLKGTQVVEASMDNTKSRCQETADSSGEVAESLDSMSDYVNNIHGLSTHIATAAEEQSSVTQELTRNMTKINNIVRELEESGRKTLLDADNIAGLNMQLSTIVGRFKL